MCFERKRLIKNIRADDMSDGESGFAQVLSGGQPAGRQLLHMRGQLSQTHIPAAPPASAAAAEHDAISTSKAGTPQTGESTSLGKGRWGVLTGSTAADQLESPTRRPGVVAGIEARPGSADQSFWVHPAAADAAIHAGAALRGRDQTGMMVSVSIGHYSPRRAMHGAPSSSALDRLRLFVHPHLCGP